MRARITREEFATLVGVSVEQVDRWRDEGLLDPEGLGGFEELDLLRWLTIRQYETLGHRSDQLAAAVNSGGVEPFLGEYLFPTSPRIAIQDAAARVGMDGAKAHQLRIALGFGGEDIPEGWSAQLEAFKTMQAAGLPWEAILEGARVYGDTLRRIAETEVRLVHVNIHERLSASGKAEDDIFPQIVGIQESVVPLLDGFVRAVHHEHLLQASLEDVYAHLPASKLPSQLGTVEATIVFLDIESFTELTQAKGDELASEVLTRLETTARTLALEHDGKLVKQIGDGLMLEFRRPDDAVVFARRVVDATGQEPDMPSLHVGIHTGPAIYRAGDYVGTTVNLAARVSGASSAGEILLSEDVAAELSDAGSAEPVGVRMLRGAERPLRLYRLSRCAERRDPVCNAIVTDPPAAQLRHDGGELWFCSQDCLRRFLDESVASDQRARSSRGQSQTNVS
jgi:class 3 adenylate cyclase